MYFLANCKQEAILAYCSHGNGHTCTPCPSVHHNLLLLAGGKARGWTYCCCVGGLAHTSIHMLAWCDMCVCVVCAWQMAPSLRKEKHCISIYRATIVAPSHSFPRFHSSTVHQHKHKHTSKHTFSAQTPSTTVTHSYTFPGNLSQKSHLCIFRYLILHI